MELNTHLKLNNELNGNVVELKQDYAKIELPTTQNMVADEQGLVHGGFAFCAADFCAMASVNDPYVVLAKSEVKFTAPVKVGQTMIFEGQINAKDGIKSTIDVIGTVEDNVVFKGTFYTATLDKHVLS